jgi:hypothetical protein
MKLIHFIWMSLLPLLTFTSGVISRRPHLRSVMVCFACGVLFSFALLKVLPLSLRHYEAIIEEFDIIWIELISWPVVITCLAFGACLNLD